MPDPKPSAPEEKSQDPATDSTPMSAFYQRHDPVVVERLRREWEAAKEDLRKYF